MQIGKKIGDALKGFFSASGSKPASTSDFSLPRNQLPGNKAAQFVGFQDLGGGTYPGGVVDRQKQIEEMYAHPSAIPPTRHIEREKELERLTTPNMRGFFPEESAGKKGKVLTFFDTETDDRGRILTIAAIKVRFNYSKFRFESVAGDPGFFRVYDPVNVDKNIARTKGSHGLSHALLSGFRKDNNVKYSSNWDLSQYEAFQQYLGDSELAGHNIVSADIPWISRPTGRDFNRDTYKKGFFDTLHYAKAITGKESAALQKLAAKYGITPESLGLTAHEAASDVVVNIKVLEALMKTNINNPFTAEALYAFGLKGVQTHYKSNLNLSEGFGQIIEGARGKPLQNLPYKGAKAALGKGYTDYDELMGAQQIVDIKHTFDIPQDVYDNVRGASSYLGENYGEEVLAPIDEGIMKDYDTQKSLIDLFQKRIDSFMSKISSGSAGSIGALDRDSQRIVKWLKTKVSKTGAGFDEDYINVSGYSDELRALLRGAGYGSNPDPGLMQRFARRALTENAIDYANQTARLNSEALNLLKKDDRKYGLAGQGFEWYNRLASLPLEDMSRAEIDAYKESKAEYFRKKKEADKQAKKEAREQERSIEKQRAWANKTLADADKAYYDQQEALKKQHADEQYRNYRMAEAIQQTKEKDEKQAIANSIADSRLVDQKRAGYIDPMAQREQDIAALRSDRWERYAGLREDHARFLEARQQVKDDAFSSALQTRMTNEMLGQRGFERGDLFKGDVDYLNGAKRSTEEYRRELELLTKTNKNALDITSRLRQSSSFYNPMQLYAAMDSQIAGVKGAAHGILPSFAEKPFFRFYDALVNMWSTQEAQFKYKWNMGSMFAGMAGTVAGGILSGGNPLAAAITGNLAATGVNTVSQIFGQTREKEIAEVGFGIQHRLNLLGTVTTLLSGFANGLRLSIGLFTKLTKLWEYMPGYTMYTATGVQWSKAAPLAASDRLLGFQAGTLAGTYNELALQQAGLYTSGAFNEKALVAAARLGIFDLAYAPMGTGNAEDQEHAILDRLYSRLYEEGLSDAEIQSSWSLINDYSPKYAAMLERDHGLVKAGVKSAHDWGYYSSMRGYRSLSDAQSARVADTATRWDRARESFTQGASLLGSSFYDFWDSLIIKPLNDFLWDTATSGEVDWKRLGGILSDAWEKTIGSIKWDEINWKKYLGFLDSLIAEVGKKLEPLTDVFAGILYDTIQSLRQYKVKLDLTGMIAYARKNPGKTIPVGDFFNVMSPSIIQKQTIQAGENAWSTGLNLGYHANKENAKIFGGALNTPEWVEFRNNAESVPFAALSQLGIADSQVVSQWSRVNNRIKAFYSRIGEGDDIVAQTSSLAYVKAMIEKLNSTFDMNEVLKDKSLTQTVLSNIVSGTTDPAAKEGIMEFLADYVAERAMQEKSISDALQSAAGVTGELSKGQYEILVRNVIRVDKNSSFDVGVQNEKIVQQVLTQQIGGR